MFDKISINSHPRSGTMFLLTNLEEILNKNHSRKKISIQKKFLSDLNDVNGTLHVVVLRNPVDTIFSSYIHNFLTSHDGNPLENLNPQIEQQVTIYINYINEYEKNFDNICFYLFEDLENALIDIALKFINIMPENFVSKMAPRDKNHVPSVKSSDLYKSLIDNFIKYDLFAEAIDRYENLVAKINVL